MCGKSIPPPQNAGFQSAGSVRKSRSTRPKDGAVSRGEKEDCRARPWPPSSSTGGFASRRRARSGGWLRFPRDGTVPTTKPSSSGAASRSPWCGLRRGRVAGLRNVPNRNCSATATTLLPVLSEARGRTYRSGPPFSFTVGYGRAGYGPIFATVYSLAQKSGGPSLSCTL